MLDFKANYWFIKELHEEKEILGIYLDIVNATYVLAGD